MKRIKLVVAYDGTNYCGWQIQPNEPTIENELDKAIYELTKEKVHVTGASRTDTGVHALGNVAVFDTESSIPGERFSYALNRFLPEDIAVQSSCEVASDFHPRHCETRKIYRYRILNTEFPVPQKRNYTWNVKGKLDIEAMKEAAKYIVGEHDFKSFCSVRTQAESTVRTIYDIQLKRHKDEIYLDITGNGFLYNMVRIITGTLVQVGKGKYKPDYIKEMLSACDRTEAGQTAPPQGLTLMNIEYVE